MQEYGLYFGKSEFYSLVRSVGGQWNDRASCLIYNNDGMRGNLRQ